MQDKYKCWICGRTGSQVLEELGLDKIRSRPNLMHKRRLLSSKLFKDPDDDVVDDFEFMVFICNPCLQIIAGGEKFLKDED